MLNEFMKYNHIKKSQSELVSDEIINDLSRKLWNDSGYNVAYMLGVVNYLRALVKPMRSCDTLSKNYLIKCIECIKEGSEVPNEIKKLVDIVLEELNEKESNNETN